MSFKVYAGEIFEVPGSINVRSSINFYGSTNIIGNLPAGSQVEILERKQLQSGAISLNIKVVSPQNKVSLNDQSPIYIWQSKDWQKISTTEAQVTCPGMECQPTELTPAHLKDIKQFLRKVEEQDNEVTDLEKEIINYSNSLEVKKTIDWAYEKNKHKKSSFSCYRAVKEALANQTKRGKGSGNNLINKWYSSQKARDAVGDLEKKGFINLLDHSPYNESLKDPRKAPKGAVLVYKTTRHRYGHIEIKLDEGENSLYAADYVSARPITAGGSGKSYTLIGVMIKPGLKEFYVN